MTATSTTTPRRSRLHRRENLAALGFVAIPLIGFLLFTLYPICFAVYASLTSWNGLGPMTFVGLDNYVTLFGDEYFRISLFNTFFYMIGIPIGLALSLLLALALNRKIPGRTAFRTIYYVPVISSLAAIAIVWQFAYNGDFGLINQVLAWFGIEGPDWLQDRWLALGALTLLTVWKNLGFNAILYLTALQALPQGIFEAASLDGANGAQRVRHLTVPLLAPMTFFVVVQALITTFQSFDLVYVLTGGGPRGGTEVLGLLMYREAFRLGDFGYGTAIAFVTLFLVLGVSLVQWRASGAGRSPLR